MIGIFDSGVGGLSVWRELIALMPQESYTYISDGAYCPYGPKDRGVITERACIITDFLISKGAEVVVIACNTATAAAVEHLRSHYDIPFVGMEPALKPAALSSESGVVGVLATAGTFKGRLYLDTLARFAQDVKVVERVGSGLVEAVEAGDLDSPQVEALVRSYVEPMIEEGADHIVLGCTHYPFLESVVKRVVGDRAVIVNPAPAVAKQVLRVLNQVRKINLNSAVMGSTMFYSTSSAAVLRGLAQMICTDIPDDQFEGDLSL